MVVFIVVFIGNKGEFKKYVEFISCYVFSELKLLIVNIDENNYFSVY